MFSFIKRQIGRSDEDLPTSAASLAATGTPSGTAAPKKTGDNTTAATALQHDTSGSSTPPAAAAAAGTAGIPARVLANAASAGAAQSRLEQNSAPPSTTITAPTEVEAIIAVSIPLYRVKNAYVEYAVDVTGERRTWRVYRRYQQFKALDQALRQLSARGSPNHSEFGALPILPRSHWMEVTNQSAELVDRRRRNLEAYLQQLLVPRNDYYAARTALYPFLHEGEVPVDTRQRVLFPALLGLSTLHTDTANPNSTDEHRSHDAERRTPPASREDKATTAASAPHDVPCDNEENAKEADDESFSQHGPSREATLPPLEENAADGSLQLDQNASVRASVKHLLAAEEELSLPPQPHSPGNGGHTATTTAKGANKAEGLTHAYIEDEDSSDEEAKDIEDGGEGEEDAETDASSSSGDAASEGSPTSCRRGTMKRSSSAHLAASQSCLRLYEILHSPPSHHKRRNDVGTGHAKHANMTASPKKATPIGGPDDGTVSAFNDDDLHFLFRDFANAITTETDVRLPPPTTRCANCHSDFTSVLFPLRCFFCKHQFCEQCLRPVELTHMHVDTATTFLRRSQGQVGSELRHPSPAPEPENGQDSSGAPRVSGQSRPSHVDVPGEVVVACSQCAENFYRRMTRYTRRSDQLNSTSTSLEPVGETVAAGSETTGVDATRGRSSSSSRQRVASDRQSGAPRVSSTQSLNSLSGHTGASGAYSPAGPHILITPSLRALGAPSLNGAQGNLTNPTQGALLGKAEDSTSRVDTAAPPAVLSTTCGTSGGVPEPSQDSTERPDGAPASAAPPPPTPPLVLQPGLAVSNSLASNADAVSRARAAGAVAMPQAATDVCLDDFQLLTVLGQGTFGKVLKVLFRPTEQIFAMKVLNKAAVHKRCMTSYTVEEMRLLTEVLPPHPYTVRCHHAFQTSYYIYMVIDYLPGGEFFDYIYPRLRLSTRDVVFYLAEIVLALEHLHCHDVAHRDLKPENIVMDADGHAHLTDFGLARSQFSRTRRRSFVGSAEYVPPETIHGEVQTTAVDWWSFGVLLYELLAGVPPFHADNNNDVYKNVVEMTALPFQPAARFSPEAISLINQLLQRDVDKRLQKAEAIKAHPFFADINWEALLARQVPAPHRPDGILENDTRFFKRTFTSEWAGVPLPPPAARMTRRSLRTLQNCFSPFPVIHHRDSLPSTPAAAPHTTTRGVGDAAQLQKVNSEEIAPVRPPFPCDPATMLPLETTRTNTLEQLEAQLAMDQTQLYGTWEIVKVEVRALDGRVTYPWGGAVCGMLVYSPAGTFSLQLAPAQSVRRPLTAAAHRGHNRTGANTSGTAVTDHLARQEERAMVLEAMLNSFTSCFGTFTPRLEATKRRLTSSECTSTESIAVDIAAETHRDSDSRASSASLKPKGEEDGLLHRNFVIHHTINANLVPDLSGGCMDMYYELEVRTSNLADTQTPLRRSTETGVEMRTPLAQIVDVQNPFRDAEQSSEEAMLLRLATRAQPVPGEDFSAQTVLTWRRTAAF